MLKLTRVFYLMIVLVVVGLVCAACGDSATVRVYKVGVLVSSDPFMGVFTNFKASLTELGYTEGQNITYQVESVHGIAADNQAALQRLIDAKVDMILTTNTQGTQTVQKMSTTMPIIFTAVSNPVSLNIVPNLVHPGGNITGINSDLKDTDADRFDWLKKINPNIKRVTFMYNPTDPAGKDSFDAIHTKAQALDITLNEIDVTTDDQIIAALPTELTPAKTDAFFVMPNQLVFRNLSKILTQAAAAKIPVSALDEASVKGGAIMAYGLSIPNYGKQAAPLADKILHGVNPGDIPVDNPKRISFFLNTTVAQNLGITVPDAVLAAVTDKIQ